jgi:hypothetical protein
VEASWSFEELGSLIRDEKIAIVKFDFRGLEVRGIPVQREYLHFF